MHGNLACSTRDLREGAFQLCTADHSSWVEPGEFLSRGRAQAVVDADVAGDHPERLSSCLRVEVRQLLGRGRAQAVVDADVAGDQSEV
jgi:hypothetical protein